MANSNDKIVIYSEPIRLTLKDYADELGIRYGDNLSVSITAKRLLIRDVPGFKERFLQHKAELAAKAVAKEDVK